MTAAQFDAKGTLRFDMGQGMVTHKSDARQVLLPATSLRRVLEVVGDEDRIYLGQQVGDEVGDAVKAVFGSEESVREASVEALTTALAGELGLRGFGALSLERWGRVLVVRIDNAPASSADFLASVASSAITIASGKEVAAAVIGQSPLRIVLGSPTGIARAQSLLASGKTYGELLAQLQESPQ